MGSGNWRGLWVCAVVLAAGMLLLVVVCERNRVSKRENIALKATLAGAGGSGQVEAKAPTGSPGQLLRNAGEKLSGRVEGTDGKPLPGTISGRGSIEGVVRTFPDGQAVASTSVTAQLAGDKASSFARSVLSDAQGRFRLEQLTSGSYALQARKDGLFPLLQAQGFPHVRLNGEESTRGVELLVYPGHTVSGRISERDSGASLAGARVTLSADSLSAGHLSCSAQSQADGSYRITGVGGAYLMTMKVEKPGYCLMRKNQYSEAQYMLRLNAENLEVNCDVQMVRTVRVSGVVESEKGAGVSGAEVSIVSVKPLGTSGASGKSDARGGFELECEPNVWMSVMAKAAGFPLTFTPAIQVLDEPVSGVRVVLRPGASVSGSVESYLGQPLQGAQVDALCQLPLGKSSARVPVGSTKTGTTGEFVLGGMPVSGELLVTASLENYCRSDEQTLELAPGAVRSGVRIILEQAHVLGGKVSDPQGQSVRGAYVHALGQPLCTGNAWTDANGEFLIKGLRKGVFHLDVNHSDFEVARLDDLKSDRQDVSVVLQPSRQPKRRWVSMTGKVVDVRTKSPIDKFVVTCETSRNISRDASRPGVFIARDLDSNASHKFQIEAQGYPTFESEALTPPAGKTDFEQTFELGGGGSLWGRVIERRSRKPIAGAVVHYKGVMQYDFEASSRTTLASKTTASDGTFRFDVLPEGNSFFDFTLPGSGTEQIRNFQITHGAETNAGDIELAMSGIVRGKLLKGTDKQPVAGARITLDDKQTQTDASGSFEFQGLAGKRYEVSAPDFDISRTADLEASDEAYIELHVGQASLRGVVKHAGVPHPSTVGVTCEGGTYRYTKTGADGTFELSGLAPGKANYEISSLVEYRMRTHGQIELSEGQTLEKEFTLPSGCISGRVEDSQGKPVSGAKVRAVQLFPKSEYRIIGIEPFMASEITTSDDGTFSWNYLPACSFEVKASKSGLGMARVDNIEVPKDAAAPPIVLRLGVGVGRLVSVAVEESSGRPIPQAWLRIWSKDGSGGVAPEGVRDAQGRIEVPGIPPGVYSVSVGAQGYSTATHEATVEADKTLRFDDRLFEAGEFQWSLVSPQGEALRGVRCVAAPRGGSARQGEASAQSDGYGKCAFSGLRPGEYTLTAYPPNMAPVSVEVSIRAGQTQTLTTRLTGN